MLKETIFAATQTTSQAAGRRRLVRERLQGQRRRREVSIDEFNVAFKVETHNHPSAMEPYGGANTGLGGVIRDTLGTGLGAKPICNTDVFCFAPPNTPADTLPPGVLHPRRVMQGVVAAACAITAIAWAFPPSTARSVSTSGISAIRSSFAATSASFRRDKSFKEPQPGDLIVAIGGRTGAMAFTAPRSPARELTSESETASGGAVQIGNAIDRKDGAGCAAASARPRAVQRRDRLRGRWLFQQPSARWARSSAPRFGSTRRRSNTTGSQLHRDLDFRSAGADGPRGAGKSLAGAASTVRAEEVEATVLGKFVPTGRLKLIYNGQRSAICRWTSCTTAARQWCGEAFYEPKPDRKPSQPPVTERLHGRSAGRFSAR